MTPQDLAARLNGRDIGREITSADEAEAKSAGLVVVFGASDDLVEFRGVFHDEAGAYGGGEIWLDAKGLVPLWLELDRDNIIIMREYFQREGGARLIRANWGAPEKPEWTFETDIPHATFDVMEDSKVWCQGIVFAVADLARFA